MNCSVLNEVFDEHTNLIIARSEREHREDLVRLEECKKLIEAAEHTNNYRYVKFYQTEETMIKLKIDHYLLINEETKSLVHKIIEKISKYVYQDLDEATLELEDEVISGYKCGDNEYLLKIYHKVSDYHFTMHLDENNYYHKVLFIIRDLIKQTYEK